MAVKNILASMLPGRAADTPGAPTTKRINLALQGGGAHGAFTCGVLEHLLSGGRAEAQKRLVDFWRAVSSTGDLPPLRVPWWSGCCRSRRSKARRCKRGST